MAHEFELIRQISELVEKSATGIELGIGDDCAIWTVNDQRILLATDMMIEGVHFDLDHISYAQAGRKALAVNLSDIAAMGGQPTTALVSLGIPAKASLDQIRNLMEGIITLGKEFDTTVVGGDTTTHKGPLVINVAITGLMSGKPVLRSGAKQGDSIFVTGALGGSLSRHHWDFQPRCRESIHLNSQYEIHSMIDLSDGLASDLRHITNASSIGCLIDESAIPISDRVDTNLAPQERLQHALADGEDFELLFTTSQETAQQLNRQKEIELFQIGEMQGEVDSVLLKTSDGTITELPDSGWKHHFS